MCNEPIVQLSVVQIEKVGEFNKPAKSTGKGVGVKDQSERSIIERGKERERVILRGRLGRWKMTVVGNCSGSIHSCTKRVATMESGSARVDFDYYWLRVPGPVGHVPRRDAGMNEHQMSVVHCTYQHVLRTMENSGEVTHRRLMATANRICSSSSYQPIITQEGVNFSGQRTNS